MDTQKPRLARALYSARREYFLLGSIQILLGSDFFLLGSIDILKLPLLGSRFALLGSGITLLGNRGSEHFLCYTSSLRLYGWGRLFYYRSHGYKSYSYRRCRQVRVMSPNAHKQPIK